MIQAEVDKGPLQIAIEERAASVVGQVVQEPGTALDVFREHVSTTIGERGSLRADQDPFGYAPSPVGLQVCSGLRESFPELGEQFDQIEQEIRSNMGW